MFEHDDERDEKPRARKLQPIKRRGNCWVCDGTGRVMRSGVTKLIACGECKGSGWMALYA